MIPNIFQAKISEVNPVCEKVYIGIELGPLVLIDIVAPRVEIQIFVKEVTE